MDFSLSEEQEEVRKLARQILEDLVTNDRLKELEACDQGIDRQAWGELAKANLLGVAIPEEYGGSAMGLFTLGVLLEEVGRTVAPLPAFPTLLLGALRGHLARVDAREVDPHGRHGRHPRRPPLALVPSSR